MDPTMLSVGRATYDNLKNKPLDHNGRSGTITLLAGEWATALAWFKIMLDALEAKVES